MMNFDTPTSTLPQALAGALRRLAQLAHTSSWDQWAVQRLTPTQRKILELLVRRGESLSLSAVARELGVTAATACDSVSALESKGLVRKQRSTTDGRALALVLTDEGQHSATQLAALPDPLWGAFDVLADTEQETLYRLSIKMIRGLQENGALPTSRMCLRCKFFDPFRYAGSATPHHCHQAQTPSTCPCCCAGGTEWTRCPSSCSWARACHQGRRRSRLRPTRSWARTESSLAARAGRTRKWAWPSWNSCTG